ncbi:hypothetical protein CEXT_124721 [Caerostris extrusa]|uniref:Uncharacterized protein n=1 Tax=Caerostris extrusa TaxID=172846 RepID=A0AAV4VD84_CAEEX|nr:hypothetical protein CEXT_124721 [Caerostris extrusa]
MVIHFRSHGQVTSLHQAEINKSHSRTTRVVLKLLYRTNISITLAAGFEPSGFGLSRPTRTRTYPGKPQSQYPVRNRQNCADSTSSPRHTH